MSNKEFLKHQADQIQQIVQHKLLIKKFALQVMISTHDTELTEHIAESLLYRLSAFVLTDTKTKLLDSVPNTLWDHIKMEYAPKWFLNKYPVVYRDIVADFTVCFPEYRIPTDALGAGYVNITQQYEYRNIHPT